MNIVKAQALAKDMQIPDLQKYANGFDPRIIPPWLAAGEIQAKMDLNKRLQMMQGAAQGEQPSVKEQIEQKAGLVAADAMKQQQAQQQMTGQMGQQPGPAPEGVPQPEPQPEPQMPQMMARGGLASVPVNFDFAGGGIVAFDKGGPTGGKPLDEKAQAAINEAQRSGDRNAMLMTLKKLGAAGYDIATLIPRALMGVTEDVSNTRLGRALGADFKLPQSAYGGDRESMTPMMDRVRRQEEGGLPAASAASADTQPPKEAPRLPVSEAQATMQAGPQAAVPAGLPAALEQKRPVVRPPEPAQRPPQAAQQPARSDTSPYFAEADRYLKEEIKAPTAQGIIDEQNALSPEAMREAAMKKRFEDQRARADQERDAYEKSKPSGLDELIRMLGKAGQYKGLSGMAPAYTTIEKEKRAADLEAKKRYNDTLTAVEGRQYEGAKELFGARTGAMKDANRSYQDRLKSRTETYASLAGVDQRRMDEALNRLNQIQLQQMRMAQSAAEASRPGEGERFAAKYLGLIAEGKVKDAEAYKDAYLLGKKGEPKEDTFTKELVKKQIEIASSALPDDMKTKQLAGLKALQQQQTGVSTAPPNGKVPPPPPGFKLN